MVSLARNQEHGKKGYGSINDNGLCVYFVVGQSAPPFTAKRFTKKHLMCPSPALSHLFIAHRSVDKTSENF
jgi:hypothetical protein